MAVSLSPLTVQNRSVGKVAPVDAMRNTGSRGKATRIRNIVLAGGETLCPWVQNSYYRLRKEVGGSRVVSDVLDKRKRLTPTGNVTKVIRLSSPWLSLCTV